MKLPRHAELWLWPYLKERARQRSRGRAPRRVWLAITDHYEPLGMGASVETALRRVARWRDRWPRIAHDAPPDAAGQPAQYSFFYPQEDYHPDVIEGIAEMVRLGVGDVEVHIHHDHETPQSFTAKMREFLTRLRQDHGLLREQDGRTLFGFIHGNWALDNSRPDGRWCGLNGEISLLHELGCYADFTMPSLQSPTQSRIVNQIYWCTGNPGNSPRSFDHGIEAAPGAGRHGDLLMITGPVGFQFEDRIVPYLEAGELAGYRLPLPVRVRTWFDVAPRVGDDLFIKLFSHGADDRNLDPLLDTALPNLFRWVADEAQRRGMEFHWVTAWQMYSAIDAIAHGRSPVAAVAPVPALSEAL
jgi:hypothetical protein